MGCHQDPENTARGTLKPAPPLLLASMLLGVLLDGRIHRMGFKNTEH